MNRGFLTIEILMAGVIFVIILLFGAQLIQRQIGLDRNTQEAAERRSEMLVAMAHILRVGRTATACSLVVGATPTLRCQLGATAWVRFVKTGTDLRVESDTAAAFSAPVLQKAYRGITSFMVCDDATMGVANGCPLLPTEVNTLHTANVAGRADRFFRVRLESPKNPKNDEETSRHQAAFFVRNPITPWGPAGAVLR